MIRFLSAAALLAAVPALAADLHGRSATGRFVATCEDLGQLCFAEACGRNQIDAALHCRGVCPSSVVLRVVPALCPLPVSERVRVRLQRKG